MRKKKDASIGAAAVLKRPIKEKRGKTERGLCYEVLGTKKKKGKQKPIADILSLRREKKEKRKDMRAQALAGQGKRDPAERSGMP